MSESCNSTCMKPESNALFSCPSCGHIFLVGPSFVECPVCEWCDIEGAIQEIPANTEISRAENAPNSK